VRLERKFAITECPFRSPARQTPSLSPRQPGLRASRLTFRKRRPRGFWGFLREPLDEDVEAAGFTSRRRRGFIIGLSEVVADEFAHGLSLPASARPSGGITRLPRLKTLAGDATGLSVRYIRVAGNVTHGLTLRPPARSAKFFPRRAWQFPQNPADCVASVDKSVSGLFQAIIANRGVPCTADA